MGRKVGVPRGIQSAISSGDSSTIRQAWARHTRPRCTSRQTASVRSLPPMADSPDLSVVVTLLNEAGVGRGALPAHRIGPRRQAVRADPRRRRLDRRDLGRGRAAARRRSARPRRALQAELRPASRHARRARAGPRRHRRDDGRRPPEPARGHPAPRRGGRGRRRRGERAARGAQRLVGPNAALATDQRDAAALHGRRRSPTSAARSTPTGAAPSSRCCRAIGKQKFTKALILSGGASVVEVDVGHTARTGSSRYSPLRLTRLALHVLAGFWPQPIQWIGVALGVVCTLLAVALGVYGVWYWIDRSDFPGPLLGGVAVLFVLGHPGLHPRARRGVPRQNPARGRRAASLHDLGGALRKRVLVTGGAGFISSNFIRHLLANTEHEVVSLDALTYAGNLENLADVIEPRAALVRARRHPRRRARRAARRARST